MNQTGAESEDVTGETGCAACARHAAGIGCSPRCERVQASTGELAHILGVNRNWMWRAEKRGIFTRVSTGPFPSYRWRDVKAGIVRYFGALWRGRLVRAEKRFKEVLSGRGARRPAEKTRTKKAKAKK